MFDDTSEYLKVVDEIEKILHKRAERPGTQDEDDAYARLRRQLLGHSEARSRVPLFIQKSANLQATWPYLRDYPKWQERREFVSRELEPLRAWLEGREGVDQDDRPVVPDSRTFLHTLRGLLEAEAKPHLASLTLDAASSFGVRKGEGTLYLRVPVDRIPRFGTKEKRELIEAAQRVIPRGVGWTILRISIDPLLESPPDENEPLPGPIWKPARAIEHDGLWFRSKTEIRVYEALKKCSAFFFVNATGVLGGKKLMSGRAALREPDFLVCLDGKWGILEVMGEHVHTNQTAPKDHDRARLFKEYGVMMIEFYDAHRCYTDPEGVVREFLGLLARFQRTG